MKIIIMDTATIKRGTVVLPAIRVHDRSGFDVDRCILPANVNRSKRTEWLQLTATLDWQVDLDERFTVLFKSQLGKDVYYFFQLDGDFGFIVDRDYIIV